MDTLIFCDKCKIEEMIDLGDAEDWTCPKCNGPECPKRESWADSMESTILGKKR